MIFTVDSYLEYFLTLLGWILNNGIFALFVGTGLWLIPVIALVIKTWRDVAKQGDDEGEKGELLIRWLSIEILMAMLVIVLTLAPMIPVNLNNIEYNVDRSKQCGYRIPLAPQQTGYGAMESTFGGQSARMPIWWMFMHKVDKGFNYAVTSFLPCQRDLRQVRFEVQREKIDNPAMLTELQQFVQQCYMPARQKLQSSQLTLTPAQIRETSWLGGKLLIKNSELYPRYRAQQPNSYFPYDPNRDAALPNTGKGGFPRCDQWWDDDKRGLRPRLLAEMRQHFSAQVSDFFNSIDNQDEVLLRTLLRTENMSISEGKVYPGYSGSVDSSIWNKITSIVSTIGLGVGSTAVFPGLDAMRIALPMVQAMLMLAIIIVIPVVTIFSVYSLKVVITLTFVQFALITTTFWWELARWLDSYLLTILYYSPGNGGGIFNAHFFDNAQDDVVINFVMGSFFLVLPALWFGAISWTGVNLGNIADHFKKASQSSYDYSSKGAGTVKDAASAAIK